MEGIHGVDVSWLHHSAKGKSPSGKDGLDAGGIHESDGCYNAESNCGGVIMPFKITDS